MMITDLQVVARETTPPPEYVALSAIAADIGNRVGRFRYGDEWDSKLYPSSEYLRIWTPPKRSGKTLDIELTPYHWHELQKQRQIQPIGQYRDDDPIKYQLNAVAFVVNALIETDDNFLILHRKKGGAKHGSIHTFGGYVRPDDIRDGDVAKAVIRELGENEETGLRPDEISVKGFFGTPDGRLAIIWHYGTGAIYARVKTGLTANEVEERLHEIPASETLNRELYKISRRDVRGLLEEADIHPQTELVIPTIVELYEE